MFVLVEILIVVQRTDTFSKLMLSLGKLSQLAYLQEHEDVEDAGLLDGEMNAFCYRNPIYSLHLPAFHDDLDFVSVHESLLEEFKVVLSKLRGKKSLDTQVETIVRERAMTLADRNELVFVRNFGFAA